MSPSVLKNSVLNNSTIFNNPEIVAKGWYIVCPSRQLAKGKIKSFDLCAQRIAVFRGQDGKVRALEAYCPHMGTDLGIGDVVGNQARCFFHHWAFDETGQCRDIPCQKHIPAAAKLQSYATEEKYGFIWVYPNAIAPTPVADFDELKGKETVAKADKPLIRNCHHHICMMNGIDAQHLNTVHHLSVDLELSLERDTHRNTIDFTLSGDMPNNNWYARLGRRFLGDRYAYSMRYAHGCIGLLTMMKDVRFLPPLHMLYAYVPLPDGSTRIQPVYVTQKRKGPIGWIKNNLLLLLTRLCYYALRGEDGKIYDNIQFTAQNLLSIDQPLVEYMRYINQLVPSAWSSIQPSASDSPSSSKSPPTNSIPAQPAHEIKPHALNHSLS
ncbi:aromatic ring-hydroxylating dioxygenase subunit alpha [cf. Phormidesmis sp. LEGE 11477]|uniref:aromatic ring-hydroxylating oxygenase subunit alpha n=1 Tax=cf. Phormidesmis sp. LEGE 11477 TaxID=1828680 RepID=UPI00188071C1|nr:aromatic ring-hydroxylating dioxygenase subunit alpha [cf. Phormidesmis sp. LEGE 11477]MBE9063698.1 aromatic ring-hydroxylating dioxygenase subunit alpha [cf. Phormidesmis sp. LEGE 11477]